MKYGDKTFKAFILSIFKIQYYFNIQYFKSSCTQKRGSQGHLGMDMWQKQWHLGKGTILGLTLSALCVKTKSSITVSPPLWNQRSSCHGTKKKKKFEWSAQASETLNKCTCIFTADNSSGISCCCGYRGRKGSKALVRQGGIRVSREISKRYCVSFHALEGQLQN